MDPFSDLYIEVISACQATVIFAPYDIRDHRIFGGFHGCHGRGTVRMGLPRAARTKCNLTGCWDMGRLIVTLPGRGRRLSQDFTQSHTSLGQSDCGASHTRKSSHAYLQSVAHTLLEVFDARRRRRDLLCILFAARAQSLKRSSVSMLLRNILVVQQCGWAHDRAMRSDLSSEQTRSSEKAKPNIVPIIHATSAHVRKNVHFGA